MGTWQRCYGIDFKSTIVWDNLISLFRTERESHLHTTRVTFSLPRLWQVGQVVVFFNGPVYFKCGMMVWTLNSFCRLGHSAQPRLRRHLSYTFRAQIDSTTCWKPPTNSQHQDHHNLVRTTPMNSHRGKYHLQSVSTISGQIIFSDPRLPRMMWKIC